MHSGRKLLLAALMAIVMLPGRVVFAADNVQQILHQLDDAAAKFRSTSADFQFDSIMTDPIPDTDTQTGTVYYERKGNEFQMAAHINEVNGKPVPKIYSYSGGHLRLYEPMINQVTTITKAADYGSYVMLGFGASGQALAEKWDIKSLGQETVDGVKTEKLELTAKDPNVRKNLPKVTIWMDTSRGVSLRQVFDEGQGQRRDCHYFNFKMNQPLPADAFTLKTNSKTVYVNR
jgi:outer membrane lipoprotein-sorting protein